MNGMNRIELIHAEITHTIIGCAFDVINELGAGFLETVYEKALIVALTQKGLKVKEQYPIAVTFRGVHVGEFVADLYVEDCVIVELKVAKIIAAEHQAQLINYLKATGVEVGLVINFGNPILEYKRLIRRQEVMAHNPDEQIQ